MALPTLFELVAGDDHVLRLEIKDTNGTPVSLVNYTFHATMKASLEDSDDVAPVQIDAEAPTRPVGTVNLRFNSSDTQNLEPRKYYFDVQAVGYGRVVTLFRGMIKVLPQVTQRYSGGMYAGNTL